MSPRSALVCVLAFASSIVPAAVPAADVVRFRGEDGSGRFAGENLPVEWSSTQNIAWKTDLPGAGSSSPVVVGDRVYLTCYTGYAQQKENPGDQKNLMRHVLCLDRASGQVVWKQDFAPRLPESPYAGGNDSHHGYSTSTPTSDGEHLYVFFGKSGVYALDLADGREVWHTTVGDDTRGWGSGSSPFLFENLLIVNASVESGRIVALDKSTGDEVWSHRQRGAWSTPVVAESNQGRPEMVVNAPERLYALDPRTGEELWFCAGIPDRGYVCPSPIAHEGVAYAIGGRQNTAIAVRLGGRGDVANSHVLWKVNKGSNVSSCVLHEGHLYWAHESRGILYGLDAATGEVVLETRIDPAPRLVYSSLAAADDKLYALSQYQGAYVFAAKPEFELLAHNTLDQDKSRVNAIPVFHDGQLLLRTDKALYCVGKR